jgi:Mg2+-importing ATPase
VWTTAAVAVIALALPYLPFSSELGFVAPPAAVMVTIVAITAAYVVASELTKAWFYRQVEAEQTPLTPSQPDGPRRC